MTGSTQPAPTTTTFLIGLSLMLVFLVAGTGCGIWGLQRVLLHHRLDERGMLATAKVVSRRQITSRTRRQAGSMAYEVTYEFDVGGRRIRGTARVDRDLFLRTASERKLQVRFLPEDPSRSLPARARQKTVYWLATVLGFATAAGALVVMTGMIASRLRRADAWPEVRSDSRCSSGGTGDPPSA